MWRQAMYVSVTPPPIPPLGVKGFVYNDIALDLRLWAVENKWFIS
jgi:hypothetical protein